MSAPLSSDLETLLAHAERRPLSVGEMQAMLHGRGFALLTMVLAAPFIIPSVPGLSTLFGLALMVIGARLACGLRPWLPRRVLERKLPSSVLCWILRMLLRVARRMERVARTRLDWLVHGRSVRTLTGLMIVSGGWLLFVPPVIPGMNTLPALSILFLAAGLLVSDGLFVLCGYLLGAAAWAYVVAGFWLGKAGLAYFWRCFF